MDNFENGFDNKIKNETKSDIKVDIKSDIRSGIKSNQLNGFVYIIVMILLSILGSLIKFDGTPLFTLLPAFFVALYLRPIQGSIIGGISYFLSFLINGFYPEILINIVIALAFAAIIFLFGYLNKRINVVLNSIIAIILSGPAVSLIYLIRHDWTYYNAVVLTLTIIAACNVILAYIFYRYYKNKNR